MSVQEGRGIKRNGTVGVIHVQTEGFKLQIITSLCTRWMAHQESPESPLIDEVAGLGTETIQDVRQDSATNYGVRIHAWQSTATRIR